MVMFLALISLAMFCVMLYVMFSESYNTADARTFFIAGVVFMAATMLSANIEMVRNDIIESNQEIQEDLIRILDFELILFDELQEMPRVPASVTKNKYWSA